MIREVEDIKKEVMMIIMMIEIHHIEGEVGMIDTVGIMIIQKESQDHLEDN